MLDMFKVSRVFYKTHVSIFVEHGHMDADVTITYDKRIVRTGKIPHVVVATPALAEEWLTQQVPVLDHNLKIMGTMSRIEAWERECRNGMGMFGSLDQQGED